MMVTCNGISYGGLHGCHGGLRCLHAAVARVSIHVCKWRMSMRKPVCVKYNGWHGCGHGSVGMATETRLLVLDNARYAKP
jgi:hypothetical protein